jgi:murein DD-endopeptidase MepM/ murein hydrolase activator NlpD
MKVRLRWSSFALAALVAGASISPSDAKFRWPAVGRITEGFCGHPDIKHIDGINLAVGPGTEIHAVESGAVAYAGNELKGFRNMILIRHADDWVSAYVNSDEMLVKRGDEVGRGQAIARIGDAVTPPRFHFELRQHGASVNPLRYLESTDPDIAQIATSRCRG